MPVGVLEEKHRAELRGSGLTDETIGGVVADGWIWSATADDSKRLGFGSKSHPTGPGIVYEYPHTAPRMPRLKPDVPYFPPWYDKAAKYLSLTLEHYPKGNHFYIPPNFPPEAIADPSIAIFITEGEKKALKACQEGFPTIALAGVWSWCRGGSNDRRRRRRGVY